MDSQTKLKSALASQGQLQDQQKLNLKMYFVERSTRYFIKISVKKTSQISLRTRYEKLYIYKQPIYNFVHLMKTTGLNQKKFRLKALD